MTCLNLREKVMRLGPFPALLSGYEKATSANPFAGVFGFGTRRSGAPSPPSSSPSPCRVGLARATSAIGCRAWRVPAGRAITHGMANPVLDPRYPIGAPPRPDAVDAANIPNYIASLAALPENLRSAVYGLSEKQIDTPYREGGWTVRQLVHHIADSHMNAYIRTCRALTEDWPVVNAYDEKRWAELSDARTLPVQVSVDLLDPLHRRWVALFESLSGDDWQRGYQHSEYGRTTLLQVLAGYEWHSRHHVAHINELRKSKGW